MPRWLNITLFIVIALYLAVGALFAAMPLLFGAYKAAALMLVAWPLVFITEKGKKYAVKDAKWRRWLARQTK